MSKQAFNSQEITEYLLGSLPPADIERLDELSLTDDEFADLLHTAEKDLVDAYIQGELSGSALERFKSHYLASPLRRERVVFAEVLQAWGEKNVATQLREEREEQARKPHESKLFGLSSVLQSVRLNWQWGLVSATFLILLAGAWLIFERVRGRQREEQRLAQSTAEQVRDRPPDEVERPQPLPESRGAENENASAQSPPTPPRATSIVSFILMPQMRGTGQLPTVSLPTGTDYVVMELQLEPNDYSRYQVVLMDQASRRVSWRSKKLKASGAGDGKVIAVRFGASLLKTQTVYLLRVTGVSNSGAPEIVGDYPFRPVK
jgi:cytoskeletal protein RodZ